MIDETQNPRPVLLKDALEEFLEACKDAGLKEKTRTEYENHIGKGISFFEQQGVCSIRQVTRQLARRFIGSLLERSVLYEGHPFRRPVQTHLSRVTIQDIVVANKRFWYWMMEEGYAEGNPFWRLKLPKPREKNPPVFSQEEIQKLLAVIDVATEIGLRDWAIVVLLLDTGIRLTELVELIAGNVDLERRILYVVGKGDKERQVPISVKCVQALKRYLETRPRSRSADRFFLTLDGKELAADSVYQRIRGYGQKAGNLRTRCSPHTFRHTFATQFIRNGGEAIVLKDILGHKKLSTVQIYVHLARGEDLAPAHDRCTPLNHVQL